MGLATIVPRSHKVQTKLYKIPKFGTGRPNSKQDTAIWKYQNLWRRVAIRTLSEHRVRMAIHFFVNFDVFKSLYLSQNKLAWLPLNSISTEFRCALSDYVDQ